MGDFRKKSCRLISRGKKQAKKFLGKKHPALLKISVMTYNAEKKNLTPLYVGEKNFSLQRFEKKIITSTKSPQEHIKWSLHLPF